MAQGSYRSFRLQRPSAPLTPPRTVGDYTPNELAQFKSSFRTTVDAYRHHLRIAGVIVCAVFFVIGLACVLATFTPHSLTFSLVFGGFALLWIFALWAFVLTRSLRCPACKHQLITLGAFCPECGHPSLTQSGWFGSRSCGHCGKSLSVGKRRNYKIKACSHCGVVLYEQGL